MEEQPGRLIPLEKPRGAWAALSVKDFRLFLLSNVFFTLAGRALAVVIGFQVYDLTRRALSLGFLGLIEAVPAIGLVVCLLTLIYTLISALQLKNRYHKAPGYRWAVANLWIMGVAALLFPASVAFFLP